MVGLTACEENHDPSEVDVITQETESTQSSEGGDAVSEETISPDSETDSTVGEPSSKPDKNREMQTNDTVDLSSVDPVYRDKEKAAAVYMLYDQKYSDKLYLVDGQGEMIATADYNSYVNNLVSQGYFYLKGQNPIGEGNGILFYNVPLNESGLTRVYAVDAKKRKVIKLYDLDDGWKLHSVDSSSGKIFLTIYNEKERLKREFMFEKGIWDAEYATYEIDYSAFKEAFETYDIYSYSSNSSMENHVCSMTRSLWETGYVIGLKGNEIATITETGKVNKLSGFPTEQEFSVVAYDKECIIYMTKEEGNATGGMLNCYQLADGKTEKRIGKEGYESKFLWYEDGKLYYYYNESDEFGHNKNHICLYQPGKGSEILYTQESVAGINLNPGVQGFKLINGKICLLQEIDHQIQWVILRVDAEKTGYVELKCPVANITADSFGIVKYTSETMKCPRCGMPVSSSYREYFEVDAEHTRKFEKINDDLKKNMQNYATKMPEISSITEEQCREHQEDPTNHICTEELRVADVAILDKAYLAVLTKYYLNDDTDKSALNKQYLYDLSTGERVTIWDFYQGTEADFRKLVAEKTAKAYEALDSDISPYDQIGADGISRKASELAGFDKSNLVFGEKGVSVLYDPGVMGAYENGTIKVFISYKDLLGRETLQDH